MRPYPLIAIRIVMTSSPKTMLKTVLFFYDIAFMASTTALAVMPRAA
jgi:hypothetical protein